MKIKKFLYSLLMLCTIALSSCIFEPIDVNSTEGYGPAYTQYTSLNYTLEDVYKNSYYQSCLPSSGNGKLIVIPVAFNDTYIDKAKVKADIETSFFGNSEDLLWESVASYYEKESFGKCKLSGKVLDWFETGKEAAYYGNDENQEKTLDLLHNAIYWASTTQDFDSSDYDSNGDGYIDSVVLIYGYKDYETLGKDKNDAKYNNLWAYSYYALSEPNKNNPAANVFMWASYDFMYDENGNLDAHTYIHETGHLFGLDDYYDYNNRYTPAGGWTMQDENVGSHDPLSRLMLGWFKNVYVIRSSCNINILPIECGDIVIVSPSFQGSPFDEYYIIDVYSPRGLNEYDVHNGTIRRELTRVNEFGCRVWHADARLVHMFEGNKRVYIYPGTRVNPYVNDGFVTFGNSNTSKKDGAKKNSYINDGYYLLQLMKNHDESLTLNDEIFKSGDLFKDGDHCSFKTLPNKKTKINLLITFSFVVDDNSYNLMVKAQ